MGLKGFLSKDVSRQFFKFCLIGLESTILNYLIFLVLLNFFSVHYLPSAGIGFISGVGVGYFFNKIYAFESERKNAVALPIYLGVYSFTLAFTLIALKILVDLTPLTPLVSNAILLPFTTIINFFGIKILAFKNKKW